MAKFKILGDKSGKAVNLMNQRVGDNVDYTPYEWYFLNILFLQEMEKNPELAYTFENFIHTFHPYYKIEAAPVDRENLSTASPTLDRLNKEFGKCDNDYARVYLSRELEQSDIGRSEAFANMATEFLIRNNGYSLVDYGTHKILTSLSGDNVDFEPYFFGDEKPAIGSFGLQKMAKLYCDKDGKLHKLPVLPTESLEDIREFIEGPDGLYSCVQKPVDRQCVLDVKSKTKQIPFDYNT